jgi:hypothetical protein
MGIVLAKWNCAHGCSLLRVNRTEVHNEKQCGNGFDMSKKTESKLGQCRICE